EKARRHIDELVQKEQLKGVNILSKLFADIKQSLPADIQASFDKLTERLEQLERNIINEMQEMGQKV
ncbi:unnamed protein product, partial [Chrysoparadoxa australica]